MLRGDKVIAELNKPAQLIPTPRRLVDIIGANRPWLTFAQCMEIARDIHAELIAAANNR